LSKILLLSASFGDGHNQAAHAVREALERGGVTVRTVDYVEWLHPAVRSFAKFSLLQGVKKTPALYGLFYRSTSRIRPDSTLQRRLNHLGIAHLKKQLQSFRPDAVVATFPAPNGLMSELRSEGFTKVPNVSIVTDYTAHPQWIHEYTDLYCVASDAVRRELIAFGVPADRICVTGIPVRSQFEESHVQTLLEHRDGLRSDYGLLPDKPLVLLMSGGAGVLADVAGWEQIIQRSKAQFCVICGRNERLYKRLKVLETPRVRVLGFTDRIDEWMSMADLVISKAGGITVTEALAMELPMLIYRPIPGQEGRNARFVVQLGAGRLANDVKSAFKILYTLVQHPEQLTRMRQAAKEQRVRGGSDRIASAIQTVLKQDKTDVGHHQHGEPIINSR
jgi:processive 1,2-diacylglycerol beta-glucosyltransferase